MNEHPDVPMQNTNRELWREGDYYAPHIFVTATGGIGITVGGSVIVRTLRSWHALGAVLEAPPPHEKYPSERQLGNLAHLLTYGGDEMVMRRAFDTVVRAYHETAPDNAHWRRALEAWLTTAVDAVGVRGEAPPEHFLDRVGRELAHYLMNKPAGTELDRARRNVAFLLGEARQVEQMRAELIRVGAALAARGEAGPLPPSPCQHVDAIERALNELGVPHAGYPAPVANAVEILRASLGVRGVVPAPPPDLASKIAALTGGQVRSLGEVWKVVWARPDAGFEQADEAVRERLRELLLGVRAVPAPQEGPQ